MRRTDANRQRHPVQVHPEALLIDAFDLRDYKDKTPKTLLARALLVASAMLVSLSAVVGVRRFPVSGETLRLAWRANLPADRDQLLRRVVPRMQAQLPAALRKRGRKHKKGINVHVAIDGHDRPFYGDRDCPYIHGGKEKKSTKWFWSYATCAIVERGQRWTIAATYIQRHETLEDVVTRLLDQIAQSGLKIRRVLLDSGFYSAGVVAQLQQRQYRFIIPVVRRGKATTGTQPFFRPGQERWAEHEWTARGKKSLGPTVKVWIATFPDPEAKAKVKRRSQRTAKKNKRSRTAKKPAQLVFACSERGTSFPAIAKLYQRRFGIESSYRQAGEALAKTTTNDPVWRLALFLIALVLRNIWVAHQGTPNPPTFKMLLMAMLVVSCAPSPPPDDPSARIAFDTQWI